MEGEGGGVSITSPFFIFFCCVRNESPRLFFCLVRTLLSIGITGTHSIKTASQLIMETEGGERKSIAAALHSSFQSTALLISVALSTPYPTSTPTPALPSCPGVLTCEGGGGAAGPRYRPMTMYRRPG